jgi:hypothetical protein
MSCECASVCEKTVLERGMELKKKGSSWWGRWEKKVVASSGAGGKEP